MSETVRIINVTEDADIQRVAKLYDEYRATYGQRPGIGKAYAFLMERLARDAVLFLAEDSQNSDWDLRNYISRVTACVPFGPSMIST